MWPSISHSGAPAPFSPPVKQGPLATEGHPGDRITLGSCCKKPGRLRGFGRVWCHLQAPVPELTCRPASDILTVRRYSHCHIRDQRERCGGVDSGLGTGSVGRANGRVGSQNPRPGLVQGTDPTRQPHACPCHWEQICSRSRLRCRRWGEGRARGPGGRDARACGSPWRCLLCGPGHVVCPLWASIFCFTTGIITAASPASRMLSGKVLFPITEGQRQGSGGGGVGSCSCLRGF